MKTITTVACFLLYFTSSHGSCPNECSSHGTCDKFSRCTCSDNFQGADCSEWVRFTYNGNYCYVHNNGNWTLTSNNFKKFVVRYAHLLLHGVIKLLQQILPITVPNVQTEAFVIDLQVVTTIELFILFLVTIVVFLILCHVRTWTGQCSCMNGFTGSACDRLECNLNCNGGGICYSMKDLALKTLNSKSERYDYSTPWDAMKMKGQTILHK